jgi:hypothetical protein
MNDSICPVCKDRAVAFCKCPLGDKVCPKGHEWHYCGRCHKVVVGKSDHGVPKDADVNLCDGCVAERNRRDARRDGDLTPIDLMAMCDEYESRLEADGDPHNGDDWNLYQIVKALKRRLIAERPAEDVKREPAFKCQNCGAEEHYHGVFKPWRFEIQSSVFKDKHKDCRPCVDGGGI